MDFVGINKTSLTNFDGYLSIVLFTSGCNFKCQFCQNSSLIKKKNKKISWLKIKKILIAKKNKIDAVVITGGEPLIHNDIFEKLKEIKKLNYLIKLDTNGTNPKLLKKLINHKLIDYVAMDIKNSLKKYYLITGINKNNLLLLNNVKKSIEYLNKNNIPFEFRTTVIKEFHNLKDLINIVNMIGKKQKYILQKYEDKKECLKHNFHSINQNKIKKYIKEIKKIRPDIKIFTRNYEIF